MDNFQSICFGSDDEEEESKKIKKNKIKRGIPIPEKQVRI